MSLKGKHAIWWLIVALMALALTVACGAPNSGESPSESYWESLSGTQHTHRPDHTHGPDHTHEAQEFPSDGGNQSASREPVSAANPCSAFSQVAGAGPAGGFASQVFSGPDVETSGTAQSNFAEAVSQFAAGSLEQALDGSVTTDCFFEVTTDSQSGVWIALTLPDSPASGASQDVADVMSQKGATVAGAVSSATPDGAVDLVAFEDLPVQAPGSGKTSGGLYFVTGEEDGFFAVMVATYEGDEGGQPSGSVGVPPSEASGSQESRTPTPTVVAVVPSGMAATVNEGLQPALEEALGASLKVDSFFQTSAGGDMSVSIAYVGVGSGGLPAVQDPTASFTETVEGLGGTVSSSFSAGWSGQR